MDMANILIFEEINMNSMFKAVTDLTSVKITSSKNLILENYLSKEDNKSHINNKCQYINKKEFLKRFDMYKEIYICKGNAFKYNKYTIQPLLSSLKFKENIIELNLSNKDSLSLSRL